MRIYPDAGTGGWWWSCTSCGFRGTSLQVYQSVKRQQSIDTAIELFKYESGDAGEQLDDIVGLGLLKKLLARRDAAQTLIHRLGRGLDGGFASFEQGLLNPDVLGLQGFITADSQYVAPSRFVGLATRYLWKSIKAQALATTWMTPERIKGDAAKRGSVWLVFPFESLPGLYSHILCLTSYMGNVNGCSITLEANGKTTEGGLMGLSECINISRDKIMVFTDPVKYLKAQMAWTRDHSDPMPAVCALVPGPHSVGPVTNTAIRCLHHDQVIVISEGPDLNAINMIRPLGARGLIFDSSGRSVSPVRAATHGKSWPVVFSSWIHEADTSDLDGLLRGVSPPLAEEEIQELEKVCTPHDWDRVRSRIERQPVSRSFMMDGSLFVEKPGRGWYKVRSSSTPSDVSEVMVSEAVIDLNELMRVGDEVWVSGNICYEDHTLPFTCLESDIQENPSQVIQRTLLPHVQSMPRINSSWRKNLYDLALARKKPKLTTPIGRVGWSAEYNGWVFPACKVIGGKVEISSSEITSIKRIPGIPILGAPPLPHRVAKWVTQDAGHEIVWALFGVALSNLIATPMNWAQRGILLPDPGEAGTEALNVLGSALGLMRQHYIAKPSHEQMDALITLEKAHDLPIVVHHPNLRQDDWRYWSSYIGRHNSIVTVFRSDVSMMMVPNSWYCIDGSGSMKVPIDADFTDLGQMVPKFLAGLQRNRMRLRSTGLSMPPHQVLTDLAETISGQYQVDPAVLRAAMKRVHQTPVNCWDQTMWIALQQIHEGRLRVSIQGERSEGHIVYEKSGKCRLVMDRIIRDLGNHAIMLPDPVALADSAKDYNGAINAEAGNWIIDKEVWNKAQESRFRVLGV
jgi:hypothetical protein